MSNRRRNMNLLLDQDNIPSEESSLGEGISEPIHVPINYLEEIDDVVECSPRSFAQAVANARRTRRRIAIDLSLECQPIPTPVMHYRENIENSTQASQNIVNSTIPTSVMHYTENIIGPIVQNNTNLEVIIIEDDENDKHTPKTNMEVSNPKIPKDEPLKEPEPPIEPILNCPICMEAFLEEMSTTCGHIFCKICIKISISRHKQCPTCRKKLTSRGLRRVFLPSSN